MRRCYLHVTEHISKVLLEEAKLDPNAKNNDRYTPLHVACWRENVKVVQLLVRDERCNPNEKNSNGDTALHIACRHRNAGMMQASLGTHYIVETAITNYMIKNSIKEQ